MLGRVRLSCRRLPVGGVALSILDHLDPRMFSDDLGCQNGSDGRPRTD